MKKAFSLAEVLITLTVIGVIAVLTMPHLHVNMQIKELQSQFKKTYNDLDQFAKYFQTEHLMSASKYTWTYGGTAFYNEYARFMSDGQVSEWTDAKSDNMDIPFLYTSISNPGVQEKSSICDASGFVVDKANRIISFDDAPKVGHNGPRICVDINGKKGPNIYGYDTFSFLFTIDGTIIPEGEVHYGNNSFDEENRDESVGFWWQAGTSPKPENCYNGRFSSTCAYYALNDISPMDSSQTYWKDFIGKREYLKK